VEDDPSWREWQEAQVNFYDQTQKRSIGGIVNDAGYRVMEWVPMEGKQVLEIGPGRIRHAPYWQGKPESYTVVDVEQRMLAEAREHLVGREVPCHAVLVDRAEKSLPFADGSFDVVVSFYSLEHLHPLERHLGEILRVLRPGGVLVGAIPAEGGIAWGVGRYLTSRRWLLRNTSIDPDKIISWEHPNFSAEILNAFSRTMDRRHLGFWPLWIPCIDVNLIVSFVCSKR
jgi:SAM-dependent methyltransferase